MIYNIIKSYLPFLIGLLFFMISIILIILWSFQNHNIKQEIEDKIKNEDWYN